MCFVNWKSSTRPELELGFYLGEKRDWSKQQCGEGQ